MSKNNNETGFGRKASGEVAEIERQLWEFAKQPDPPAVPEARLRPGAFLYRIHRNWHSLGRGSGMATHSFRALKDELLQREPPVRNLQPKLYGSASLSESDAGHLIDVMLETWEVARDRNDRWRPGPLQMPAGRDGSQNAADAHALTAIRNNILLTLFKTNKSLLLEEPVGVPPEIFMQERGRSSQALIIPTKGTTTAYLSPSNAYGGFSSGVGQFFDAAAERLARNEPAPLLIWVLRLGTVRDNSEFHQAFHCLATYSAALTNWYFRLSRRRGEERNNAQIYWEMITKHSVFAVHGLPDWAMSSASDGDKRQREDLDEELADLDPNFFVPSPLPIVFSNHPHIRRHRGHDFGLNVSVEINLESKALTDFRLRYWLFPNQPGEALEETAETTALPVFDAGISPGGDFDLSFSAVYDAAAYRLGFRNDTRAIRNFATLFSMGWKIMRIKEFQKSLLTASHLGGV